MPDHGLLLLGLSMGSEVRHCELLARILLNGQVPQAKSPQSCMSRKTESSCSSSFEG